MDKPSPFWLRFLLTDWQRRATALLAYLFLLQFVSWFASEQDMWWPETVTVVKASLLMAVVLELIPRMHYWWRRAAQLLAVLTYQLIDSNYHPVLYRVRSLRELGDWFYDNVWQLHPFLWFALGAWLAYVGAVHWMTSRLRIGAATILSVLALSIRDSFSLLTLWPETAMIILCGLLLLSIQHFDSLRRRNPEGWAYLAEYPGTILVTIAVLLGVTFIPGVMMPSVRPLLNDPYTAYLLWKGEDVPAFGKTVQSDSPVFGSSGSAESGYSRNDEELGGGFEFDYSPVMRVETDQRSYWRGETLSLYTGNGWEASDGDQKAARTVVTSDTALTIDPSYGFDSSKRKTVQVKQTVTMLREEERFPVLFGASPISRLVSVDGEAGVPNEIRWAGRQAALLFDESGNGKYPKTYQLESEMPIIDEAGLALAPAIADTRAFAEYLQLPRGLPPRVKQLAQEITAEAASPYAKAKLLETYLQMNYPYTNKPRTELGTSKDFVDSFLFEIKEGYCDYYSTAMAVLSRTLGIPSRWVKGYSSGQNELEELGFGQIPMDVLRDPTGRGAYMVRNSDAHSWVELYFPGYGWIPFEPTSGFLLPQAQLQENPSNSVELPEDLTAGAEAVAADSPYRMWYWAGAACTVVLLVGALLFVFRRRLASGLLSIRHRMPIGKLSDPNKRVVQLFDRLLHRYRRRGFLVHDHETAREAIQRLKKKDIWMAEDLEQLLQLFEKAKYSPRGVTPEECSQAESLTDKLKKAM